MFKIFSTVMTVLAFVALTASMSHVSAANDAAEAEVLKLLEENRAFHAVPEDVFEQLGWDLPDGGAQVKSLADAAPGGAFDPRKLEALATERLGYQAKWHEVRYEVYGLEWDIPGVVPDAQRSASGVAHHRDHPRGFGQLVRVLS